MTKRKRASYFRLMGLVTCVVTLALIIGLIITIVQGFIDGALAWTIIANFLNVLAVVGVGTGLTNLFYSHANLLDEESYCAQ